MQFTDETDADLKALVEADFGPLSGDGSLTNLILLDWLHYRARLIPCRRRGVIVSPEVAGQMADSPAIGWIKAEFEAGRDLSAWLSDRVRKRKDDAKADLMFNDWQISHLHLGNIVDPRNKATRTSDLLFAHVKADRVVFLDVKPHGSWGMQEILRILVRVSPKNMQEMKGILGTQRGGYTDDELVQLRQAGLTAPIQLDEKVYLPPGAGVSTSRHATRLVLQFNNLARQIRHLHNQLTHNALPHSLLRDFAVVGRPVRLGIKLHSDGCLVLYEKTRSRDLMVLPPLE